MTKINAVTTYREAIEQLQIAEEAIDQAHAMLLDLKLNNWIEAGCGRYRQTLGRYRQTPGSAYDIVHGLLEDLKNAACPECGEPLADNIACLEQRCPSLLSAEDECVRDEAQYEFAMEKRREEREGR